MGRGRRAAPTGHRSRLSAATLLWQDGGGVPRQHDTPPETLYVKQSSHKERGTQRRITPLSSWFLLCG
jgi:hypothetical protein